tara:strand:+ start:117 stop:314 length:198 start_codon:yes stop_codon:yes gene_type:complete
LVELIITLATVATPVNGVCGAGGQMLVASIAAMDFLGAVSHVPAHGILAWTFAGIHLPCPLQLPE